VTESQCRAIRAFAAMGKGVIASGETSLYNQDGERLPEFLLSDLLAVRAGKGQAGATGAADFSWERHERHTYFRLHPEVRANVDGPETGAEPPATAARHPVLAGFDETDILPFSGRIESVFPHATGETLLTFIPSFPIYPPETAWMRQPDSGVPALVVSKSGRGGRIAYLAADLDRCFFHYNLPDHGDLLANIVRWVSRGEIPLKVEGAGFCDCSLYRQPGRVIVHIVNLANASTWRSPVHEFIPIGPLTVSVRMPDDVAGTSVRALVAGKRLKSARKKNMVQCVIPSIVCHEVLVIE